MNKFLKDILYKVSIEAVKGSTEMAINNIDFDSRKITENDVFIAIRGTVSDGHDYIEKAINLGAIAIVCDTFPDVIVNGITYIQVKDTNLALAYMGLTHENLNRLKYFIPAIMQSRRITMTLVLVK